MQGFLKYERQEPKKREVFDRIKDFSEIYEGYSVEEASLQAERCVQCGDPYCHNRCPLHNFIPQWLKRTAERNLDLAFAISNESSPYPEILGKVCPQDRLCEGDCTLNDDGYGAITIGAIEAYISEQGFAKGLQLSFPDQLGPQKVAIVGSGPAGLSCATYLLRAGIQVDMFEKADRAGGLLTYGIPGFKLDKSIVQRRVDMLKKAGMNLTLSCEVGKDVAFDKLLQDYDAVFLGLGATEWRQANIMNEDMDGCYQSMELLTLMQRKQFGLPLSQDIDLQGKKVIIIGGGDTAMDCARTSLREKAASVTILYRRDEENMPGSKKEVRNASEEGAEFLYLSSPKHVNVDRSGKVIGLTALKTALGEPDSSGRQSCQLLDGSEFELEADIVVFALGFTCEPFDYLTHNGIDLSRYGTIQIDEHYRTNHAKVYAGGDCYRGADLVVRAALDGREAAASIVRQLLS